MSFEALLNDLDALQKARTPHMEPDDDDEGGAPDGDEDDERIAAAADRDFDEDGESDGEDDLPEDDDEDEDDEHETFGKSFSVTTESGSTVEAYDGTAILKAMHERLVDLENTRDENQEDLRKAAIVMHKQSLLIKSLHTQISALQAQGNGRKSVISLHEKPSAMARKPENPHPQVVLAKAMAAQQTGKITGTDVARIESYLSRGLSVPSELADLIK